MRHEVVRIAHKEVKKPVMLCIDEFDKVFFKVIFVAGDNVVSLLQYGCAYNKIST